MPDFIRANGLTIRSGDPSLEYIVRVSDIILIAYDVARDATTIYLRDFGQLPVSQGPDEIESRLAESPVSPQRATS